MNRTEAAPIYSDGPGVQPVGDGRVLVLLAIGARPGPDPEMQELLQPYFMALESVPVHGG